MSFQHITTADRYCIQSLVTLGFSNRAIASEIGFSHTAINKELTRNGTASTNLTTRVNRPAIIEQDFRSQRGRGLSAVKHEAQQRYARRTKQFQQRSFGYDAKTAQHLARKRRSAAGSSGRKIQDGSNEAMLVTTYLKKKYSPEIIAIRSAQVGDTGLSCGKAAIYGWIYRSSDTAYLKTLLRRKGKKPRYQKTTFNQTSGKRTIHARPLIVTSLGRSGDLEGDTIVGKDKKDRLLTHVDRRTGIVSISRILGYNSFSVSRHTNKDIARAFTGVHTITYDNGNEFSAWKLTESRLAATIYFADPYKSSQRGRNENTNGLIRQYFPKGTDFKRTTDRQVRFVETELNNRPRKRYNGLTPIEYAKGLVETLR